jgi:hypothetical protein
VWVQSISNPGLSARKAIVRVVSKPPGPLLLLQNCDRLPLKSCSSSKPYSFTDVQLPSGTIMRFCLFATASRPDLGPTQPPIQWVPAALTQWLKRLGLAADYSPPANAEVKNASRCNATPPYVFTVWCLVKHIDNFTFTFTFLVSYFCNNETRFS